MRLMWVGAIVATDAAIMPASMAPDEWQHKSKLSSIMLTYKDMWDLVEYQVRDGIPSYWLAVALSCLCCRHKLTRGFLEH